MIMGNKERMKRGRDSECSIFPDATPYPPTTVGQRGWGNVKGPETGGGGGRM